MHPARFDSDAPNHDMGAMSLDHGSVFVKHQTWSEDRFLGGRLIVSQPLRGFRAGLDSVVLGASVSPGSTRLCDLGAGVGTAALVALAHHEQIHAVLVETEAGALALAERNISINGFTRRARTLRCDVTAAGAAREAAGLPINSFTSVIANPPFFSAAGGTLPQNRQRGGARHMEPAKLDLWARTAAAIAVADGEVVFIYPSAALAELLAAISVRFGAITVLPLSPRVGAPASRVLVRGRKGSRAPLTLLASRAVHGDNGRTFTLEFDAILRGGARLDW